MYSRFYNLLGVRPNATKAEIKSAYRSLAKKYHPDISTLPNAREKFIEITKAYETIMEKFDRPIQYKMYTPNQQKRAYRKYARARKRKYGNAEERAKRYSKMKYKDFSDSSKYKHPYPILKALVITCAVLTFCFPVLYHVLRTREYGFAIIILFVLFGTSIGSGNAATKF